MKELLRRLLTDPVLALELGLASLFANVLALASPLFVTQVLNRYVSSGVDATLMTMTLGVLVAILLEFGFRQARLRLAMNIGSRRDHALMVGTMGILTTATPDALQQWSASQRRELVRGVRTIQTAYSAPNLVAVLDLPFSLLFVAVLFALSPVLGVTTSIFVLVLLFVSWLFSRLMRQPLHRMNEINLQKEALTQAACGRIDTIRVFAAGSWMVQQWQRVQSAGEGWQRQLENRQGVAQGLQGAIQSMLSVFVIALGARLVLEGELQVGTLIGANILAARALGPIARLVQLSELMIRAEQALARLEQFAGAAVEPKTGAVLKQYKGGLELRDLAKSFPPAPIPIFESLNLTLPPGAVLVITGDDGVGKSVLARMMVGLTEPDRGQILADGVDIRQLDPKWWRRQLIYLPRDPEFLEGCVRDNITLFNPQASLEELNQVIADAGLGSWLDNSPQGLLTPLTDGGHTLAPGVRKRLGLARALMTHGRLALFDRPTEHMDAKGLLTIYAILHKLSVRGVTLIVITNDVNILRGASLVLDLNTKPKPTLVDRLSSVRPLASGMAEA